MKKDTFALAQKVVRLLDQNNLKIATAESCTGGLLSAYITSVSGSSNVFELGVTSYSCRIKNKILSVDKETINQNGAISKETAKQMAENVLSLADADISLSITGAAGPTGSEGHAPGLVFVCVSSKNATTVKELNIEPLGRDYVREIAVEQVLELALKTLEEKSYETH